MLQFLYLPPPAKIGNCLGIQYLFVFEIIWNQLGYHEASLIMIYIYCEWLLFSAALTAWKIYYDTLHTAYVHAKETVFFNWKMFSYLEMCTKTQAHFFNWPTIIKIKCDFILHQQRSILKIAYRVIKLTLQTMDCVAPLVCTTWDQALHMCKTTTSKSNPQQKH